ncbi:MAG: hypothetical protein J3R72DRAFT_427003 [Linnemannia gamsii]|nr:MAG: hypothetical protein J3R72DRAFT_427003 [Linnemannia gamsii]
MTKSMICKSTILVATIALALLVLVQTISTTVSATPVPHGGHGGLTALTAPVVNGVVDPRTTGGFKALCMPSNTPPIGTIAKVVTGLSTTRLNSGPKVQST